MEIYSVKISPSSIGTYKCAQGCENCSSECAGWYDTSYQGWLKNFLIESKYYNVWRKGSEVSTSVSDILGSKNFIEILNSVYGIFEDEASAIENIPQCPDAKIRNVAMVNPNAGLFFKMFTDINGAISCLVNDPPKVTEITIPVYISETIRDIGLYEEYIPEDGTIYGSYGYGSDSSGAEEEKKYSESQLFTLKRQVSSYDEEGNELPYFINENGNLEIPYLIGLPCNVVYEKVGKEAGPESSGTPIDAYFFNELSGVSYIDEDGSEIISARNKTYYDGSMPDNGNIRIFYRVRSSVTETGRTNGILYTEEFKYSVMNSNDGRYIQIGESVVFPENYESDGGIRDYAEISDIDGSAGTLSFNPIVKREVFMHIHDSKIDHDDVYIERGVSASYEAFNVLGEMNDIEDIERYRDDWFGIKGKND